MRHEMWYLIMKLKQLVSYLTPRIVYVEKPHNLECEVRTTSGKTLVLRREKSLGEEILFKCYEKQTEVFRGFVVKNIKYGFYGDVCDNIKKAIDSADRKWFEVMGINRTQRQK